MAKKLRKIRKKEVEKSKRAALERIRDFIFEEMDRQGVKTKELAKANGVTYVALRQKITLTRSCGATINTFIPVLRALGWDFDIQFKRIDT